MTNPAHAAFVNACSPSGVESMSIWQCLRDELSWESRWKPRGWTTKASVRQADRSQIRFLYDCPENLCTSATLSKSSYPYPYPYPSMHVRSCQVQPQCLSSIVFRAEVRRWLPAPHNHRTSDQRLGPPYCARRSEAMETSEFHK